MANTLLNCHPRMMLLMISMRNLILWQWKLVLSILVCSMEISQKILLLKEKEIHLPQGPKAKTSQPQLTLPLLNCVK